jgi:hypothetical protein
MEAVTHQVVGCARMRRSRGGVAAGNPRSSITHIYYDLKFQHQISHEHSLRIKKMASIVLMGGILQPYLK